jgi:hypothetical protein
MRILKTILVLAWITGLQQCSYSQSTSTPSNQATMDSSKKDNPVYSRTDTSQVNMTEEQWQKVLPKDVYYIARQKGTERPWSSKYEIFQKKAPITVQPVVMHFSEVIPSLKVVVAGRVSMSLSVKAASSIHPIIHMVWTAPKYSADVAKLTSVTYLTTALPLPVCATV